MRFPALTSRRWRWESEMHDTAQALSEAGLRGEMISAIAADMIKAWEPFKNRTDTNLHDVLSASQRPTRRTQWQQTANPLTLQCNRYHRG